MLAAWQGQGCGVLGKGAPTTWGAAGAPCRTLLLWGHWGSSEKLLERAGTKQDPAELGAAAPTVEVAAGLQVIPPAVQGRTELPCASGRVCRQGWASLLVRAASAGGASSARASSCRTAAFVWHTKCVSQSHRGVQVGKDPQNHQLQVLN